MKFIELTNGQRTVVDDEDYERYSRVRWVAKRRVPTGKWYATAKVREGGKQRTVLLHRLIMGLLPGDRNEVDHVNGDTLDNRKSEMRVATRGQNQANYTKPSTNVSGYKGVSFDSKKMKFKVFISVGGKNRYVGQSASPLEAAMLYDTASRMHYGRFAKLNFPERL